MASYRLDFLNDKEFEDIVNGLLSKKHGVRVESFKTGKDHGVDGRFYVTERHESIVQSKHWERSGYSLLISYLKDSEVAKVHKLQPARYIFATSVPLSRANKSEISALFSPHILRDDDVLGAEDIQNLLVEFPEVARNHPKLWLAATDVLDAIISASVVGRSKFELSEIEVDLPKFVYTQVYSDARSKLEKLSSIIITGQPGVGKTTLAKQLLFHYASDGYQVVKIQNDLSEGESLFKEDKRQIFYFDDFLGRNYLEALSGCLESSVVDFMRRVGKTPDKRFVLTSRNVILCNAKSISEVFRNSNIEQKEFELDIGGLSQADKARIFYNHMWYGKLPTAFMETIKEGARYREVINHKNYNPRIIEFITDRERIEEVAPENYWPHVSLQLNNPEEIWRGMYERQLNDSGRWLIRAVVFGGGSCDEPTLRIAYDSVFATTATIADERTAAFNHGLEIACGSVLKRTLSTVDIHPPEVTLLNPSMGDYIISRYGREPKEVACIILSIGSVSSLTRLKSMRHSQVISTSAYGSVCSHLAECYLSNTVDEKLKLKLAAMITVMNSPTETCITFVRTVAANAIKISEPFLSQNSFHLDIICLIEYGYNGAIFNEESSEVEQFIYKLIEERLSVDDQRALSTVLDLQPIGDKEGLITAFRSSVISMLSREIDSIVEERSVIENILDFDDFKQAREDIREFVVGFLNEYSIRFPESNADDVADACDIDGIISRNREAHEEWERRRSEPKINFAVHDDAFIDELFRSDFPPVSA
jgi:GTPase SAR1 family protein